MRLNNGEEMQQRIVLTGKIAKLPENPAVFNFKRTTVSLG